MQEKIVYAGQLDCYQGSHEVLKKLTDIEIGAAQIFRITNTYGKQIAKETTAGRTLPPLKKEEVLYAEADGSMVLMREEGWKEIKLCRLFKSGDCLHPEGKKGMIKQSQYFGSIGSLQDFTEPVTRLIEDYGTLKDRLVFITDGAVWLRNWIADYFPEAVSILDYYHACEHLYQFADSGIFKDEKDKKQWGLLQEALLKNSEVEEVIKNIAAIAAIGETNNKAAEQLIQYYNSNKERMDYKRYKQIGCGIIGSGAIEAAHRTVIQKRMKLSGQRWSKEGAIAILNLRTTEMNNQWAKVIHLVKNEFIAKAA